MGDRDVDEIIEQWRASARAAGEPTTTADGGGRRRLLRRIGMWRIAGAALALLAFGVIAVPVLTGGPDLPAHLDDAAPDGAAADGAAADGAAPDGAAALAQDRPDPAPPGESAPALPTVDQWFGLMESVDRARGAAYGAPDASRLSESFDPDGPALARELAVVESLRSAGAAAQGWGTELLAVSPIEVTADKARLRVLDQRSGYDLVNSAGARTQVPPAAAATWLVDLVQREGRWLVVDVVPEVTSRTGQP